MVSDDEKGQLAVAGICIAVVILIILALNSLPHYSATIESLTLIVIIGGWLFYNKREKERLLSEKKIDTYSELIYAIQNLYLAANRTPPEPISNEIWVLVDKAYSKALFYGSDEVKKGYNSLWVTGDQEMALISAEIPNFIHTMIKEIQPDTKLQADEIRPFVRGTKRQ